MLSYQDALWWLRANDDCSWLDDENPIPSVTACLVADIYLSSTKFNLNEEARTKKVIDDLQKTKL